MNILKNNYVVLITGLFNDAIQPVFVQSIRRICAALNVVGRQ